MAISNPETIEIREYSAAVRGRSIQVLGLYIDQCHRASVERHPNGQLDFRFEPIGTFDLDEAKVWLQGLLELMVAGEALRGGKKDAKKKRK